MKRVGVLIAALLLTAVVLVLTTYQANDQAEFPGYMEADLVLVGSEQGGRMLTLNVEEGDRVSQGDPVFTLESEEQKASVAAARARVQEAEARLADAKAPAPATRRNRSARSGAGPGEGHVPAIEHQSRAGAKSVRQRLGVKGAIRRCGRPA